MEPCNEGDCCAFEWSGWSNCCLNAQNQPRQVKWKGNKCTGEWVDESQACIDEDISIFGESNLAVCDAILNINKRFFTGFEEERVIISEVRELVNGNLVNRGFEDGFGMFISNGIYLIDGVQYELENVNGVQNWYVIGANGIRTKVEIEVFKYNNGLTTVYYYKFADRWFRWLNGNFVYTGTPPFFTTETNVVNSFANSNFVLSRPTSNAFTFTNSVNGGIPLFRPVNSVTNTEVVVRQPVVTEIVTDNGNVNSGLLNFNTMFNLN